MSQQRRLSLVLALNIAMVAGLVIVGLASNSFGVLAAGGDFLADSMGLSLGIIAIRIARHPRGHPRATTHVALINAAALLIVTLFAIGGGVNRLINHTPEIHALPVLAMSIVATAFMAAGAFILGRDAGREDLHMRSVLLDTIADALAAAAVAVSGSIIYLASGLYWLDSVTAVGIGLIIGLGAIRLMRDVVIALRHREPLRDSWQRNRGSGGDKA